MTKEDLIKNAGSAQPQVFEKVATMLALAERLDPEFAKEASADINEILDTTQRLITEYDENVKVANAGGHGLGGMSFGERMGHGFQDASIGLATGLAANFLASIAGDIYSAAKTGLSKSRNFKAIMTQNPGLKERFTPGDLRKSFSTLHRYAPEFTADPTLGGQLLGAMTETPENQMNVIKTLIDSRDKLLGAKARQFSNNGIKINISDNERVRNGLERSKAQPKTT